METLFIYLVKSGGLIGMFYLAYFLLLRKETFFNSNRWFLLSGLITSVLLPLLVFKKIIWVDPSPANIDWSKIPVTTTIENDNFEINWYLVFGIIYGIGIIVFLIKFVLDFYSLSKVLKGKTIQQQADFKFIDVTENISPFSYFDYIVYNSSLYSTTELENILEHEKVHSSQNHTVDVLISRLFCVFFWYNPFVWLYKKAIVQNLEFIADSEASKIISDKKAYQFTLLKITTHENCVAITNHFYQSLIKKRIVMLNITQSNKRNSWKYALVLPILGAFVFFFQVKVVAQEKLSQETKTIKIDEINRSFQVTKETTNEAINSEIEIFKNKFKTNILFSEIKRNIKGPIIALKVYITSPNKKKNTYKRSGNEPIKPFMIFIGKQKNNNEIVGFSVSGEAMNKENWKKTDQFDHYDIPPPPPPTTKRTTKIIKTKINANNEKPIIIIDGKRANPQINIDDIDSKKIAAINILKGIDAEEKYGKNGRNGVIEIYTKESRVKFVPKNIKQIIIVNGKRTNATRADFDDIDNSLILSTTFLKEKEAQEKYGKDGENGAIEISTKENVDFFKFSSTKAKKEATQDKSKIKNDNQETAASKKEWLKTYKVIWEARVNLERMEAKKEQAKVELEKARVALKSKLFSE